jgi:hypothetical protein
VILLVLVALAVRLDAAPPGGSPSADAGAVATAIRYANLLTGVDRDDDPDDDDAADAVDEAAEGEPHDPDDPDPDDPDPGDPDDRDERVHSQDVAAVHGLAQRSGPDWAALDDATDDREELAWESDGDELAWQGADDPDAIMGTSDGSVLGAMPSEVPGSETADDASVAASAGAVELRDAWTRRATSAWGRIDVGLTWQRRASEPRFAPPHRTDELWLVATWRR